MKILRRKHTPPEQRRKEAQEIKAEQDRIFARLAYLRDTYDLRRRGERA